MLPPPPSTHSPTPHIHTPHAPTHTTPEIFTISVTEELQPCLSYFKTLKIQLH